MCGGVVNPKLGKISEVLPCTVVKKELISGCNIKTKVRSNLNGKK